MASDPMTYCLEQVRRFDHDRYLSLLLAPEKTRDVLAVTSAFGAEISRVPLTVSEPMLGQIRLQWWRETLEAISDSHTADHEVAQGIADITTKSVVRPSEFIDVVDGYERELDETPFESYDDLSRFLDQTTGVLTRISAVLLLDRPLNDTEGNLVERLARGQGLVTLLRNLPKDAMGQRFNLPLDLARAHEIDPHDVFQGTLRPGLSAALHDLCGKAQTYLMLSEAEKNVLDDRLRPLFWTLPITRNYLKSLQAPGFDPFRTVTDIPAFRRQLSLMWAAWRGPF